MKWVTLLLAAFIFHSCASFPTMSYSTSENVPVLQNKNQVRLSAVTLSDAYGFQGAWACTNHLALMGSYDNGIVSTLEVGGPTARNSWEFAPGYYKSTPGLTFEIFGGMQRYHRDFGVWMALEAGQLPADIISTNATSYFVQADIAKSVAGRHCFAATLRAGYLVYDHFLFVHYVPYGGPMITTTSAKSGPVIQPCITYRYGLGSILSFQAQIGMNIQQPVTMYDSGSDLFLNIGLSARLFTQKKGN